MSLEAALPVLRLHPKRDRRVLGGHQWIFSNEIAEPPQGLEAGAVAQALTHDGRSLGVGFYNPKSLIAWRWLSSTPEEFGEEFFFARLKEALAHREFFYPGQRCGRLAFGESDGLAGLVVDRYGDHLVLQVLSAGMEARIEAVAAALRRLVSPKGIFLKNDHRSRALEGLPSETRVLWGEIPERVVIEESGLRYSVPLGSGQKTGFYFDQRDNRSFLAPFFKGRRVVDLYCYAGAFALHAARAGAERVYGVDSSGPAVALARENAVLNGLEASFDEGDAADALEAFGSAPPADRPTMILLDPPSLVPAKKDLPKAMRAYVRLNAQALAALPRKGLLATSTCSHHVSRELFVDMLREALGKSRRAARLLALRGQAADHPVLLAMPETEYLHFALLEVL